MENSEFIIPADIKGVCNELKKTGKGIHLLAGGTDLMVAVNLRNLVAEKLICLRDCGLDYIKIEDAQLKIGASATLKSIIQSEAVQANAPLLVEACRSIGSPAIRNVATLGGNVCNASPAADGALALLALDAAVDIVSASGQRSVAIETFFTGPGETVLKPNELVKEFSISIDNSHHKWGWLKIGQRKAEAISVAAVAVSVLLQKGRCKGVRIALGSVAPIPLLARKASAMLEGKALDIETIEAVARTAAEESHPIDDHRASAWYRKQVVSAMVTQILTNIAKEEADARP